MKLQTKKNKKKINKIMFGFVKHGFRDRIQNNKVKKANYSTSPARKRKKSKEEGR